MTPGSSDARRPSRPASGPQLWRANRAGRLTVSPEPVEPIDATTAFSLVAEIVAEQCANADDLDRRELEEADAR